MRACSAPAHHRVGGLCRQRLKPGRVAAPRTAAAAGRWTNNIETWGGRAGVTPRGASACNIGEIGGSLLVFGGPYSNLEATEAVLEEAEARRIPPSRVICTGDVVAYCSDPAQTVAAIREAGVYCVQGNCEESLGISSLDCGCGFDPDSACRALSVEWFNYASSAIGETDRAWMRSLPQRIHFTLGHVAGAALHGSASSISEFVFRSTPEAKKMNEAEACGEGVGIVLGGHCGLPFSQLLPNGMLWHNAGVVGMPANDGTPRVWYSVLTPEEEMLRVEHISLAYDHTAAAQKMRERGLPAGYADALTTGRWPSLDVLPAAERAQAGVPLAPARLSCAVPWSELRTARR